MYVYFLLSKFETKTVLVSSFSYSPQLGCLWCHGSLKSTLWRQAPCCHDLLAPWPCPPLCALGPPVVMVLSGKVLELCGQLLLAWLYLFPATPPPHLCFLTSHLYSESLPLPPFLASRWRVSSFPSCRSYTLSIIKRVMVRISSSHITFSKSVHYPPPNIYLSGKYPYLVELEY